MAVNGVLLALISGGMLVARRGSALTRMGDGTEEAGSGAGL
jgi:hypothetical protein